MRFATFANASVGCCVIKPSVDASALTKEVSEPVPCILKRWELYIVDARR